MIGLIVAFLSVLLPFVHLGLSRPPITRGREENFAKEVAAGSHHRLIHARARELDVLAAHEDRAALGALLLSSCRERAGDLDGLGRSARRLAPSGGGAE